MEHYDVVIIGGGVVGSAIAYFLTRNADFDGRIAVIERDSRYLAASSSLSMSAIRQQFATGPNISMSQFSFAFLRAVGEYLSVDEDTASIGLRESGYLILSAPHRREFQKEKHLAQRKLGVDVELLEPAQLSARFPWLNTAGVGMGSLGLSGEGWFDGPALLQSFRRKARAQGARFYAAEVSGLARSAPSNIGEVMLANGERIAAGTVVNAAGAWSGEIARMAGVELPVIPSKRCVFVVESPAKIDDCPYIFDISGFWLRPEGSLWLCGMPPAKDNDPTDFSLEVDYELFEETIWPAIAQRVPFFEQLRLRRAWAGLYEYNTFDQNGIIGRHPELTNFIFATGFSGHGMMHAPATGSGVSDLITYGEYRSIDLTAFSFNRIAEGRPIEEHVY